MYQESVAVFIFHQLMFKIYGLIVDVLISMLVVSGQVGNVGRYVPTGYACAWTAS